MIAPMMLVSELRHLFPAIRHIHDLTGCGHIGSLCKPTLLLAWLVNKLTPSSQSVFLLLIVLWRRVRVGRASAENEEPKVQRIIVNLSGEEDHLVIFGNKPSVMVRLCQSHSSAETSV
jgi:hypothetical protein